MFPIFAGLSILLLTKYYYQNLLSFDTRAWNSKPQLIFDDFRWFMMPKMKIRVKIWQI